MGREDGWVGFSELNSHAKKQCVRKKTDFRHLRKTTCRMHPYRANCAVFVYFCSIQRRVRSVVLSSIGLAEGPVRQFFSVFGSIVFFSFSSPFPTENRKKNTVTVTVFALIAFLRHFIFRPTGKRNFFGKLGKQRTIVGASCAPLQRTSPVEIPASPAKTGRFPFKFPRCRLFAET